MMNTLKSTFIIFIAIFYLASCTEDFQLTEPYKDIPVIYGIINRSDTAQYFRIEKGFLDENIPATTIAQRVDSLYYPNPKVTLFNQTTNKSYTLARVDGNLEGYPRADGPFAKAPNYLYKLLTRQKILNGGDSLRIELKRSDSAALVTSRISLVNDIQIVQPDNATKQMKFFYESRFTFLWRNKSNTSAFDLKALIYIDERDIITKDVKQSKIIEVPLGVNIEGETSSVDNITTFVFDGSTFYNFLHDNLTPEAGIERNINNIDFYLTGGGPEIGDYYKILNANTGITASQEIPRFTNVYEGPKKVFGIFSSVVTIVKRITIQEPTLDSLRANPLTRELNFK